jgi:hypothetical protein
MLLGLGVASGASVGVNARRMSPIVAQMVSDERAAALRHKCLNLVKTCRFGSGPASERTSRSRQSIFAFVQGFGLGAMSDLSPLCAPKRTSSGEWADQGDARQGDFLCSGNVDRLG